MFRVRTHRVLIRWRRAAARWKVEVRSFPTRRRTPLTDIEKYFSEPDEKKCSINCDQTNEIYRSAGWELSWIGGYEMGVTRNCYILREFTQNRDFGEKVPYGECCGIGSMGVP